MEYMKISIKLIFFVCSFYIFSCDCVGILKERNVDVEQRFPFHHAAQSRKKSTKCRMIFRTTVLNSDGVEETLQVASVPILCSKSHSLCFLSSVLLTRKLFRNEYFFYCLALFCSSATWRPRDM